MARTPGAAEAQKPVSRGAINGGTVQEPTGSGEISKTGSVHETPGARTIGKPDRALNAPDARDVRKTESALEFERIFARYLVGEMTKESFRPADNHGMPGAGSEFYRDLIVDALSNQLARERRLGFADLVMQFWNRTDGHHDK